MSWMISYRLWLPPSGVFNRTRFVDDIKIIDEHPAVWVTEQNRERRTVARVYSTISIPADDEERVRQWEKPETYGDV